MRIFGLHGFLGQPSDMTSLFHFLEKEFKNNLLFFKDPASLVSVNYLNEPSLQPRFQLKEWGNHFNRYIFDLNLKKEKKILIGYSQGARLAMQAFENNPSFWDALVLISGNPGVSKSERQMRLGHDNEWAEKFLKQDFQKIVRDWNQQKVFIGSKNEPMRSESDYDREQLAMALKNWSVAWQESFEPFLIDPLKSKKIMAFYGSRDEKYKLVYQEIGKKNPRLALAEIEDSGHRIIFDQPERLAKQICQFLINSPVKG
jgi:2-succinyl-6-hydroxy-2,4-cyclohexadiene-1-carboxylate synthase